MSTKPSTSQADIVQNKLNLFVANQQRLLASWLPPPTAEETARAAKSEEEREREDQAIFTPVPANLGVGAKLPSEHHEGHGGASGSMTQDRLRKKLLGKRSTHRAADEHSRSVPLRDSQWTATSRDSTSHKERRTGREEEEDDGEEEEAGRSALGRAKKMKRTSPMAEGAPGSQGRQSGGPRQLHEDAGTGTDSEEQKLSPSAPQQKASTAGSARPTTGTEKKKKSTGNYLDEMLAEKALRKKKKKKKTKKTGQE
ncbi:MAG: hypothetical protein M4579_005423 [Chaenotheca gracillima]|nr:MAG: hypothetical protein M4579_005423 [Chaenotheca gracillima]